MGEGPLAGVEEDCDEGESPVETKAGFQFKLTYLMKTTSCDDVSVLVLEYIPYMLMCWCVTHTVASSQGGWGIQTHTGTPC